MTRRASASPAADGGRLLRISTFGDDPTYADSMVRALRGAGFALEW